MKHTCNHGNYTTDKELKKELERKDKELKKELKRKDKELKKELERKDKELKKELERKDKQISILKKKIATLETTHTINNINNNNLIQINLDANCFQDRVEDYMNAVHGAIQFAVSALNDSDGDGKLYICSGLEKNLGEEFFHSDNVVRQKKISVGPWK